MNAFEYMIKQTNKQTKNVIIKLVLHREENGSRWLALWWGTVGQRECTV